MFLASGCKERLIPSGIVFSCEDSSTLEMERPRSPKKGDGISTTRCFKFALRNALRVFSKGLAHYGERILSNASPACPLQTLKKGVTIAAWAVAVFDPCCNDGDRIAFQLIESCSRRGMVMKSPAVVQKQPRNSFGSSPEERVETMFNALRPYAPVFILAILAEKDSPIYGTFILSLLPYRVIRWRSVVLPW